MYIWICGHKLSSLFCNLFMQPPEQLWQVCGRGGEGSTGVHQVRAQQHQQQQRSWNPAGESEQVETFLCFKQTDVTRIDSCTAVGVFSRKRLQDWVFVAANGNVFKEDDTTWSTAVSPWWKMLWILSVHNEIKVFGGRGVAKRKQVKLHR